MLISTGYTRMNGKMYAPGEIVDEEISAEKVRELVERGVLQRTGEADNTAEPIQPVQKEKNTKAAEEVPVSAEAEQDTDTAAFVIDATAAIKPRRGRRKETRHEDQRD